MSTIGFENALGALINRYSQESESNTPDFILAQYIVKCLQAYHSAVQMRENWFGRNPNIDKILSGELPPFQLSL